MNLRQIQALQAVIESGTVSRAAERLSISQPAVSKLLNNLERTTGLALFDRRRGRLSPTPEALMLFEEMERVFQGVVSIDRYADEIRNVQHGSLRVGVMPALSTGFVQEIVARLIADRPKLQISIHARTSPKLAEWIVGGHLDVGLTSHEIQHSELIQQALCRRRFVCVMPLGHRLAQKKMVDIGDFEDETFISVTDDALRQKLDRIFDAAGIRRRLTLEAPMAPTICALVAKGLGVSVLSPLYLGVLTPLVAIRPFRPVVETEIRILLPRHRSTSLVAQAFIDAAYAFVSEIPPD
jgi:DNA-binding transcriptional LysR family regulator